MNILEEILMHIILSFESFPYLMHENNKTIFRSSSWIEGSNSHHYSKSNALTKKIDIYIHDIYCNDFQYCIYDCFTLFQGDKLCISIISPPPAPLPLYKNPFFSPTFERPVGLIYYRDLKGRAICGWFGGPRPPAPRKIFWI